MMNKLKTKKVWLNWKYIDDKGKIPYNPATGKPAKPNDPTTWSSYELALQKSVDYNGIGFALTEGVCAIDIDHASDSEARQQQADDIIRFMNTYAELSPSGKGYHIIFRCVIEKVKKFMAENQYDFYTNNQSKGLECYIGGLTNKYLTYTGKAINSLNIEDRTEQLIEFLKRYMKKESRHASPTDEISGKKETPSISDEEVLKIAVASKGGKSFSKLFYTGDTSEYDNDQNKADLALCAKLAYFTQGNRAQIDRLFRQSKLYREKWEREDYQNGTIEKAIASCESFYRPIKVQGEKQQNKPVLRIEDLERYLFEQGISIRFNEISRRQVAFSQNEKLNKEFGGYLSHVLVGFIYDSIRDHYTQVSYQTIQEFLAIIGIKNRFNPVLELINSLEWDGCERIPEIYAILGIQNDTLSQKLVFKWLHQCLSMARNTLLAPYGGEGVCCLVGAQGIGKTSFFKKLALKDEFFLEGAVLNSLDKDTTMRATAFWITELGEIEGTFKRSDIENLKSLITNRTDIFRKPYGRQDETYPRHTSFCATCNSQDYLTDPTGNRRFWTIPVENIDLERLKRLDVEQLWAEVNKKTKDNLQGFRLTHEERKLLDERNGEHEQLLPAEDEIRDILALADNSPYEYSPKEATSSEIKKTYESLKSFSGKAISAALTKLGYKSERKTVNGKQGRYRKFPMPRDFESSKCPYYFPSGVEDPQEFAKSLSEMVFNVVRDIDPKKIDVDMDMLEIELEKILNPPDINVDDIDDII